MLRGERIYLTPLDVANAETARAWINDPEINRWMLSGHIPVSRQAEEAFYEAVERNAAAGTGHVFEVRTLDGDRYIGNCGLDGVSLVHRTGEVGIVIGELAEQGKGYGADAIRTLLRFAFDTLGLHTVRISYIEGNERAAHLYPKLGFSHAGRFREHVFLNGAYHDLVMLDMTEAEWREQRGK